MKHAFFIIYNVLKRIFCDASHLKAVLKPHRLTTGYSFPALIQAVPTVVPTVDLAHGLVPIYFRTVAPMDFHTVDLVRETVPMVDPMDGLVQMAVPTVAPMDDLVQVVAPKAGPMDGLVRVDPKNWSFVWKAAHAHLPPLPTPQSLRKNYQDQRFHCQPPAVVPLVKYHP
jgi:hypothetical protein